MGSKYGYDKMNRSELGKHLEDMRKLSRKFSRALGEVQILKEELVNGLRRNRAQQDSISFYMGKNKGIKCKAYRKRDEENWYKHKCLLENGRRTRTSKELFRWYCSACRLKKSEVLTSILKRKLDG